eukprot:826504-Rhodomonas_salina.2
MSISTEKGYEHQYRERARGEERKKREEAAEMEVRPTSIAYAACIVVEAAEMEVRPTCIAMSGIHIAYRGICTRREYRAYAAMTMLLRVGSAISLRACYAMPGTDIAHGPYALTHSLCDAQC